MKKIFSKLSLFLVGFSAIGLFITGCSSEDSDKDIDGGGVEVAVPIADFSSTNEDLKVTFTNNSTDAQTYVWEFGDTQTSTDKDPVYDYAEAGTYSVKLTAMGQGGENSVTKDVTVTAAVGSGVSAAIVVDGDFSEWADVPEEILFTAVLDEEATTYKRLKEVKVTSDDTYIYVYLKLDSEHGNALDIYINNDLSADTGYNGWMWKELAANFLLQGLYADNYDMRLAGYDESADGGWGWLEPNIIETGSGLFTISDIKTVEGTIVEFEGKIVRDFIPDLGSQIRMSFGHSGIEDDAWSTSGGLPTVPTEGDNNSGLLVTLK